MKVSNCCSAGPMNEVGICPSCKEHCEWIEEGSYDATQELREFGKDAAQKLAGHLSDMKAEQATIPVTLNGNQYIVIVKLVSDRCPVCDQRDVGQYGERPCKACGLPTEWGEKEHWSTEQYAEMQRLVTVRTGPFMKCCVCGLVKHNNDFSTPDVCTLCHVVSQAKGGK